MMVKARTVEEVIKEIHHRMGEHIEMQLDQNAYVIQLLAKLLLQERSDNEYYKKVLREVNR